MDAFIALLAEAQLRSSRPSWYSKWLWQANQQFDENNRIVHEIARQVVDKRRANPIRKHDLVDAMLNGVDSVTKKGLSDETIIDNMITFLVAGTPPPARVRPKHRLLSVHRNANVLATGHETTSGLLSFLFALVLTHPEVYRKLQQEIDTVLHNDVITPDHLQQLPYTRACLREALRLQPPSGVWTVTPLVKDPSVPILLDGQYEVRSGQTILIVNPKLHRDPEVWGDDAEEFKPERMLNENFKKLPKNCFKVCLPCQVLCGYITNDSSPSEMGPDHALVRKFRIFLLHSSYASLYSDFHLLSLPLDEPNADIRPTRERLRNARSHDSNRTFISNV